MLAKLLKASSKLINRFLTDFNKLSKACKGYCSYALVRICNKNTNLENFNFFVLTSPPLVSVLQSLTSAQEPQAVTSI